MPSASYVAEREALTHLLFENPYDPGLYLDRARCYEHLGFPDLATGDAYRALLLTDEADDESGEYHELVLNALFKASIKSGKGGQLNGACNGNGQTSNGHGRAPGEEEIPEDGSEDEGDKTAAQEIAVTYAQKSYQILAWNLTQCGCLRAAFDFCQRGSMAFPKDQSLREMREVVLATNRATQLQWDPSWDESSFDPKTDLPEQGSVRRELYPWNTHEPDRFSATSLAVLNSSIRKVAPKCAVRSVSLPLLTSSSPQATVRQLGLFATTDLAPGETVLNESSILTANNRHLHPLCDACSSELPPLSASQHMPACPECHDTVFCSPACAALAQSLYHPAICGKDVDAIGKDTPPKDAANALFLLLLGRTMALAETQNTHPLDLPETKYIWGDFIPPDSAYLHSASPSSALTIARHLPFSFRFNILAPLHLLEKMDLDIFAPAAVRRYDSWVLNTLYAKFRGTASARLSLADGRPEVCAVHPMWSLANHSCDPNLRWEWGGRIQFLARRGEERVEWAGRRKEGGIRRGEEILNHYCDVGLSVRERREWAVGALGGVCACERCGWEEGEARRQEKTEGEGAVEGRVEALRISN